ncbi:MAG: hypothetical protein IJY27_06445 [Clostridia bacterium]|nr:hypothetical protein [Clostridia bacterium]
MKDWKKLGKKLLFPPLWLMIILTLLSASGLVAVFLKGWEESPIAYVIYVLAFYTLGVVCIYCSMVLPRQYRAIKQKIYDTKYGNRFMTDVAFKNHVTLYVSLGINLLYVGVNVLSYFLYGSIWFTILAVYYTILAVMRFLLLRYFRAKQVGGDLISEWRRARVCAIILLLINFVLSGAVLMILYQNRGFEYHGMMIYVMAMYAFYVTTHSVVDIVKYRKYNSPVLTTAKIISLAAAMVSMLSLETAMLSQFGTETTVETKQILIAATGAGVSVVVITMAVYMIVRATKQINKFGSLSNGQQ